MHGSLHLPLLDDLWNLISLGAALFEATHAISIGYSMEGFGVWQLPASSPSVFDIAISVAGYGIGTKNSHTFTVFQFCDSSALIYE